MIKQRLEELSHSWCEAKKTEKQAQDLRRHVENEIKRLLEIDEQKEGVITEKTNNYTIKISSRINRKVDSDLLQEIAHENSIPHEALAQYFNWSASIDVKSWKHAAPEQVSLLSKAVTAKPSRPTFKIEENEQCD